MSFVRLRLPCTRNATALHAMHLRSSAGDMLRGCAAYPMGLIRVSQRFAMRLPRTCMCCDLIAICLPRVFHACVVRVQICHACATRLPFIGDCGARVCRQSECTCSPRALWVKAGRAALPDRALAVVAVCAPGGSRRRDGRLHTSYPSNKNGQCYFRCWGWLGRKSRSYPVVPEQWGLRLRIWYY